LIKKRRVLALRHHDYSKQYRREDICGIHKKNNSETNKRGECLHEIYTQKLTRDEKEKKIHNLISQTVKSQLEIKKATDKEEIQGTAFQQKIPDE
jgi:hypothetical protein